LRSLILGIEGRAGDERHLGLEVARGLHALLRDPDIDFIETPGAGVDLFELAAGYGKVVVVDAVNIGEGDVGELRKLGLGDLELKVKSSSGDSNEYRAVLEREDSRGTSSPLEISIYAIEMGRGTRSDGDASELLRSVVPRLVEQIAREEFGAESSNGELF
jgi:hydrogenase maturation protease